MMGRSVDGAGGDSLDGSGVVGGAAQDGVNFQVFGHQGGGVDWVRLCGHAQQRDPPARREVRVHTFVAADAVVLKVREGPGRPASCPGRNRVNADAYCEVLGIDVISSEDGAGCSCRS